MCIYIEDTCIGAGTLFPSLFPSNDTQSHGDLLINPFQYATSIALHRQRGLRHRALSNVPNWNVCVRISGIEGRAKRTLAKPDCGGVPNSAHCPKQMHPNPLLQSEDNTYVTARSA